MQTFIPPIFDKTKVKDYKSDSSYIKVYPNIDD